MSVRGNKTLYLDKLTVSFDGFKALNDLTLQIEPGELRCIIGPNGAGKTTMMDVITGKTRPDSGTVRFGRKIESACRCPSRKSRRPASAANFRSRPCSSASPCSKTWNWHWPATNLFLNTLLPAPTPSARNRIYEVLEIIGLARIHQMMAGVACLTARSNGWKSACC